MKHRRPQIAQTIRSKMTNGVVIAIPDVNIYTYVYILKPCDTNTKTDQSNWVLPSSNYYLKSFTLLQTSIISSNPESNLNFKPYSTTLVQMNIFCQFNLLPMIIEIICLLKLMLYVQFACMLFILKTNIFIFSIQQ